MRHVIIGGSIAGISAAKAIRGLDAGTEIIMISEERTKMYYRPMIPLIIEKDEIDITFTEDPLERYNIKAVYDKATDIDVKGKQVLLSSGEKLTFDKLLIATGSSPVIPDIPGINGEGVFTLRTMDDALKIKRYSAGKKNAVVIGGGLVGIKAATALKHLGLNLTIIEQLSQILFQRLDKRGAQIISNVIKDAGICVITNDSVSEAVLKDKALNSVNLSSGETIKTDIIIIAAGSKPNLDSFKKSGIKTNRGIIINENLQTSIPDIYAAGDVVEYKDLITDMPSVSALWTNAQEMGSLAGKNMSGANIKYKGFLGVMNSTEIFGIPLISVGLIEPEGGDFDVIVDDSLESYRKLVFDGDVLVGAVFIGDVTNAGIYTNIIKNKIPAGRLKEEAIKGNLSYINFIRTVPVQSLLA
ncbi:MAG: FAD-dependent oxidoreductase [Nitrospirota bacterium]